MFSKSAVAAVAAMLVVALLLLAVVLTAAAMAAAAAQYIIAVTTGVDVAVAVADAHASRVAAWITCRATARKAQGGKDAVAARASAYRSTGVAEKT